MAKRPTKPRIKPPTTVPVPAPPVVTNPDGIRTVYCNQMNIALSQWDVHLMFNEVVFSLDGSPVVEKRADVVMAHGHFRAMLTSMHETIKTSLEQEKDVLIVSC